MRLLRRIQHDIKMKKLHKKFDYVIGKMKEHENDVDSREWKSWANLNLLYLMLMDKEVNEYGQKIKKGR